MPQSAPRTRLDRIGRLLAFASVLTTVVNGTFPAAQDSVIIACRPEAVVAELGTRVGLRAFTSSSFNAAATLTYRWQASAGVIEGDGATVAWQLPAAQPNAYTASVEVRGSGATGICTMQVFAVPGLQRGGTETRRRFVTTKQDEEPGFHRYSYFLLGSKPTDERMRRRYLAALEAYTSILPMPEDLVDTKADLNVTLLPVTISPATNAEMQAEWLLKHYDWERARFFLRRLPGDHLAGPYIVSYHAPLGGMTALDKDYLYQDLSTIPPELVIAWVREFMLQSAQEQFWKERTGPMLALKMRTVIGVLASNLPDVKGAVAALIVWR